MFFTAFVCFCLAVVIWDGRRGKLFVRTFGTHVLQVSEGAEIDSTGEHIRLFNTSYFEPHQLMFASRPFRVACNVKPTFQFVVKDGLVCVFDDIGIGYMVIIDQSNHQWFVTSTESMTGGESIEEFNKWCTKYQRLKSAFPELPYEQYFSISNDTGKPVINDN
jgi:hypothetical protein